MKKGLFSYSDFPKQKVQCPLCSGLDFSLLASNDRYGMGLQTVNCVNCGLVMTNPVLTREALEDFYKHHYRQYYNKVETPNLQYIGKYGLARRAEYTVVYLENQSLFFKNARVLDVGCSEGSILKEIKRREPTVVVIGIEPGVEFSKFARDYVGCTVYSNLAELAENEERGFDLIILNHVLEHIENPVDFLTRVKQYLGLCGSIYVDVPDVAAYTSVADLHIAHRYHFSCRTMVAMAHKAGVCIAHIGRHRPPRHPPSIRCVLMLQCSEVALLDDEFDDRAVYDVIKLLDRWGWCYRLLHKIVGSVLQRLRKGTSSEGASSGEGKEQSCS